MCVVEMLAGGTSRHTGKVVDIVWLCCLHRRIILLTKESKLKMVWYYLLYYFTHRQYGAIRQPVCNRHEVYIACVAP